VRERAISRGKKIGQFQERDDGVMEKRGRRTAKLNTYLIHPASARCIGNNNGLYF